MAQKKDDKRKNKLFLLESLLIKKLKPKNMKDVEIIE